MAENFANNARSVLIDRVVPGQTTINVRSSATFPAPNFRIVINTEYMLVTGVSGNQLTVVRAIEGTAQARHAAGADVVHVLTAEGLTQKINEVVAGIGAGPGPDLTSLQAAVDVLETQTAALSTDAASTFARVTVNEVRLNEVETQLPRLDILEDKFSNHIPIVNDQSVVLRGSNTSGEVIRVEPDELGFFGVAPTPIGEINAAATDAATTQALVNNIRTLLLGKGLVKAAGAPNPTPSPPPPAPPPAGGGGCTITITAPSTIANNQTLSYVVAGGTGIVYQTWLLYASSIPTSTGSGSVQPQTDSISTTNVGNALTYTKNISNIPAGNYYIWAKDNNGSTCQDSFTAVPITITAAASPPPAPSPGVVPAAILAMAPAPAVSKYTATDSTNANYTPNGAGDYSHQIFSGQYDSENQSAFVGSGQWNLTWVGADPAGSITGNQFRSRTGVGTMTAEKGISFRVQAKLPSAANIGAYNAGAGSEVVLYPNCGGGKRLGGVSEWPSQQPGVRQPNTSIQFKDIQSHWIGAKNWSLTGVSGGTLGTGWIAHDMRVCSSGRDTTSYADSLTILLGEVLVTRLHLPISRNLDPGATSGHYRGEYTIWGTKFRLFIQQGATNTCLIQLRIVGTETPMPNHFPMHEIWKFLTTTTYAQVGHTTGYRMPGQGINDPMVSPNSWYFQCMTGIEMEHDTYDLQVDTYYDRINLDL